MALEDFKKAVINLKAAHENAKLKNVSLNKRATGRVYDYQSNKEDYYRQSVQTAAEIVKSKAAGLSCLVCSDFANGEKIEKINELVKRLDDTGADKGIVATNILALVTELNYSDIGKLERPKKVPSEIKEEVLADIDELERTFNAGCLRSSVIICGRLLEIALHRKYFEATGNDALEKNPGIGLGNLIAKLRDKNVEIDPGLTNQVHLINQVRVSSVHVKKTAFRPSQQQAQAIVLYTLDVLNKLFA